LNNELLMIPGPTEVAYNVMREMSTPMEPHYGKEWASFYIDYKILKKAI